MACSAEQDPIVVSVSTNGLRASTVRERYQKLNKVEQQAAQADPAVFAAGLVVDDALEQEALRRGIGGDSRAARITAMKKHVLDEASSVLTPNDVTDEEVLAFHLADQSVSRLPARVVCKMAMFKNQIDAQRFAATARSNVDKAEAAFVASFDSQAKRLVASDPPLAILIDVDVTRHRDWPWPHELVDPAFSAKVADTIGPIRAENDRTNGVRYFVLRVSHNLREQSDFASRKEMLRMYVYRQKLAKEVDLRIQKLASNNAKIDRHALAEAIGQPEVAR